MFATFLRFGFVFSFLLVSLQASSAEDSNQLERVYRVTAQPLIQQTQRLVQAMDYLGMPLSDEAKKRLEAAYKLESKPDVCLEIQRVLDQSCLFGVNINPESRVKVDLGPAKPILDQNGWQQFLVKVHNEAGVTAPLKVHSPNAGSLHGKPQDEIASRWLDMQMFDSRPMMPKLSGLKLEYRIIQLYSRDVGKRSAVFSFDVGQGTQDIGFRNDVAVVFNARKGNAVELRIHDEKGMPTTAGLTIRDAQGRVYPSQAKRLAPDFAFHPQIYRNDREKLSLPAGVYTIEITRGPEYLPQKKTLEVTDQDTSFSVKLERWVDPAAFGWWSGDHHIHAAGCKHYTNPTEGVHAPDMLRHCLGEDLKVGANLTWGPCFDYQKQFFTGEVDKVSKYPYLLRYDVEVSGFGSHRSGHLCLLRLRDQIYPGGESKDHWPTLCLNTYKWAKKQGAICGPAHSGWGLTVKGTDFPTKEIPPFDGIGACEYIADVTHMVEGPNGKKVRAVDFISLADTPYVWELNIWYHTLNCGYETRVSGETDFPCIYGERVGLGRSYIKLKDKLDYDQWCQGIQAGNGYVSDGRSHLIDFKVDQADLGTDPYLKLAQAKEVKVSAKVAAYLPEEANDALRNTPYYRKPFWHIERSRIIDDKGSRQVEVELVANGEVIDRQRITADGKLNDIVFNSHIKKSSWVALRILPSSHTNPIFITVDDKPIRASKDSAQWCLDAVKKCRAEKKKFIAESELKDFEMTYDHAEKAYARILSETK